MSAATTIISGLSIQCDERQRFWNKRKISRSFTTFIARTSKTQRLDHFNDWGNPESFIDDVNFDLCTEKRKAPTKNLNDVNGLITISIFLSVNCLNYETTSASNSSRTILISFQTIGADLIENKNCLKRLSSFYRFTIQTFRCWN